MSDDGSAVSAERSEFTLPEWRCAVGMMASFGAGIALLVLGGIDDEDAVTAVGAALLVLPFPLSWIGAAIEIRAGRAEPGEKWTRRQWILKWVRVPISAGLAAGAWWLFGCSGGAFAGLILGLLVSLADPVGCVVAVVAHRLLDRPAGFVPAPSIRIEGPKQVFGWFAATTASASAGAALGVVGGLQSRPVVLGTAAIAFCVAVAANALRRHAVAAVGSPRRFTR